MKGCLLACVSTGLGPRKRLSCCGNVPLLAQIKQPVRVVWRQMPELFSWTPLWTQIHASCLKQRGGSWPGSRNCFPLLSMKTYRWNTLDRKGHLPLGPEDKGDHLVLQFGCWSWSFPSQKKRDCSGPVSSKVQIHRATVLLQSAAVIEYQIRPLHTGPMTSALVKSEGLWGQEDGKVWWCISHLGPTEKNQLTMGEKLFH